MYKNNLVASVVCRHGHKGIAAVQSSTKCCSTPTCRKERPGVARDIAFTSQFIIMAGWKEKGREEERKGRRKEKS